MKASLWSQDENTQALFGPTSRLKILVAELVASRLRQPNFSPIDDFISWFGNDSSGKGRAGVRIGDLWVRPRSGG
jgi:hypothetical protein